MDINYPQFSTRTNSTARINKDLRSVVSQLPNLMCMQVSGMRPTLSSLLQDQPDLASRITVLHLGDLGNPLSNRPSEPQLGFLEVLQQATQLKTLVVTAIDELSRPQDIEAWWSALLSPRAHPMTLGLTNPPPLPQDWVSRFEAASDSSAPRLQLRQLHLNYSRRDGSFDTVLSLRRLCSGFSTLRGLELSGIRDWAGEEALRQAPLPELQVLALDSMASLAAAHHHHDPERLSRLLQHWTPQQQLRLGRCEGLSLEHIRSALEAATTAASRVKEVYLSTACLSLFEDLASLLAFQEALRQPPTGVKVCFDPQLPRLLQAQTLLDSESRCSRFLGALEMAALTTLRDTSILQMATMKMTLALRATRSSRALRALSLSELTLRSVALGLFRKRENTSCRMRIDLYREMKRNCESLWRALFTFLYLPFRHHVGGRTNSARSIERFVSTQPPSPFCPLFRRRRLIFSLQDATFPLFSTLDAVCGPLRPFQPRPGCRSRLQQQQQQPGFPSGREWPSCSTTGCTFD